MKPNVRAAEGPSAVTPSLWWVGRAPWGGLPPLTTGFDGNIFLLKGDRYDVLLDAGLGPSIKSLEQNIRLAGSTPERIREIWVTHSHADHFFGACIWAAKYPRTVCRLSKVGVTLLRRKDFCLTAHVGKGAPKLPKILRPIEEGSVLLCPPFELKVEATPGHVPDGLCFRGQVDGLELLVTGDTLIGDQPIPGEGLQKGMLGWIDGGYCRSDVRVYRQTMARLAATNPDLILPGHGLPQAGPAARRSLKNGLRRLERLIAMPEFLNLGPYFGFGPR